MHATCDPERPDGDGSRAGASTASVLPSWLLMGKVMTPAPPAGYLHRAALLQCFDAVLERRLTVLQAPGGFGKTTVLADVSQTRKKQGALVAWLSLDQDDTPEVFGHYLARAFEHAGLDLGPLNDDDAWASSPCKQRLGMLARAVELYADPCLLVLDELELLPRPTVESVDQLLKHGPSNLHFAMAFRFNPGLDLALHILGGTALVVKAEQFRFSIPDIARFFDGALSQRELRAVAKRTAGWPVALMVDRNMRVTGGEPDVDAAGLAGNFVGVRLLHRLSEKDRKLLFDLAVFDWIAADVVDEVLGSSDARLAVSALSSLEGLLLPVDGDRAVWRLHPLVREYCTARFAVDNPARKRSLHTRIARVLARRGHLGPACRHAAAAGDSRLVGELIEAAGLTGLWLREGAAGLTLAGGFLTPEITAMYPRLELLHCVNLHFGAKFDEAAALYEIIARKTDGFTRDRDGGDAEALFVDSVFTRAALAGGPSQSPQRELDSLDDASERGGARTGLLSSVRYLERCVFLYQRAKFEEIRRHGLQAHLHLPESMRNGRVFASIYLGMAAMVQGRVQDAVDFYGRARQVTRDFFPTSPHLATSIDILSIELDLERNRKKAIRQRTLQGFTELRGLWNEIYAVAVAVRAELTFEQSDRQAVIAFLNRTIADVRAMGARDLESYVSALLVLYLVKIGRAREAGRVWVDHGLPCPVSDLLDLEGQSWRRMEALSCARVVLLAQQDDLGAAVELVDGLYATASAHGMTRTELRALGLSIDVAHRAGQEDRALARLVEFLRRLREVDYVRPLVSLGEVSRPLLERLLETKLDAEVRSAAEETLSLLGEPSAAGPPEFTPRELEVLAGVRSGRRNKEIAKALGITDSGVRHHLRNIYRKIGVSRRFEAVRYAEDRRVLP